jgi:hypothetical protein
MDRITRPREGGTAMLHTIAAAAATALVLALPATGLAMNGPTGGDPSTVIPLPANFLRDGKYSPTPWAVSPVPAAATANPGGFGYQDAAVDAAIGVLVLAAVGGTVLVIRHERDATHAHVGTSV